MDKKIRKIPLAVLITVALLVGGALGAWYLSLTTITHTISVEGSIDACTSFLWTDLADKPAFSTLETRCTATLFESAGTYNQLILVDSSNTDDLYLKVDAVVPSGASMTAEVFVQTYTVGSGYDAGTSLGTIAVDGSESVQIISASDPLWAIDNDYDTGVYHCIKVRYGFDQGSLGIGDHDFDITVSLGDSL